MRGRNGQGQWWRWGLEAAGPHHALQFRPQSRHHGGWKACGVDDGAEGGVTSAHRRVWTQTPSPPPGGSRLRQHPLLSFLFSAAIRTEAVSLRLGSLPPLGTSFPFPPRLFTPGPREPTNFPSSASPTECSARGVDSVGEFRGIMGRLEKIARGQLDRRGRCRRQLISILGSLRCGQGVISSPFPGDCQGTFHFWTYTC